MWEKVTPADIERAKQRLASRRIETLTRHAEELKQLDTDQTEIDVFERMVAAFTEKHLTPMPVPLPAIAPPEDATPPLEQSQAVATTAEIPQEQMLSSRLQVHHQTSPNFGVPFRKVLRG